MFVMLLQFSFLLFWMIFVCVYALIHSDAFSKISNPVSLVTCFHKMDSWIVSDFLLLSMKQ